MNHQPSKQISPDSSKEEKKPQLQPVAFKTLFRYAEALDMFLIILGLFFSVVSGGAFPLTTVVFGGLIDSFGKWEAQRGLNITLITADELTAEVSSKTIYFIYLAVTIFISTYLFMACFVYTSERQAHKIRENYLKAVLRQNIGWFDGEGPGEIAVRITSDTLLIQDGIGEKVPLALNQAATFLSGFVIAFIKSWQLTLVLLSVIPLVAISGGIMNLLNGRFQTRILDIYSIAGTIAEEAIAAVRTVTAFGAQAKLSEKYNASLAGARKEGIKKSVATGLGFGMLFFFIYCAYSLTFYYGSILLKNDQITSGTVVNVFFAVLIGAFALGQIAPDLQAFSFARSAGAKIFYTIDRIPEIDSQSDQGKIIDENELKGHLKLVNCSFAYPARSDITVLDNVSLEIKSNTTVALVGQSGSGKSTIIQLLERFYDPQQGHIELDGHSLKDLNLLWLRRQIGLVSQEPILFEGTVAQNVAFGLLGSKWETESEQIKMQFITKACQEANAHDFILKLPKGYDTQVGERGMLLSGGQKQRICIARAIVKDPKILLLDEATSALDTTSERIVQDALDKAQQGRTTIVIAHRLSTIRDADNIIVMVKGKIIEMGTHDNLLKDQESFYAKLVNAQQLAAEEKTAVQQVEETVVSPIGGARESLKSSFSNFHSGNKSEVDLEHGQEQNYSTWFVFKELMRINYPELKYNLLGLIASIAAGMIYPCFAIAFGTIIQVFSLKGSELTTQSNFWALIFLVIALGTLLSNFLQNTFFGFASEYLVERIRQMAFASILRQDIAFFDDDLHSTGILASNLAQDAQKIQGLSGVTAGTIVNVTVNILGGIIVALCFGWKLALVATTSLPLLLTAAVMRIRIITYFSDKNKKAYEKSAQMACEAVAAIRTVQSLTKEDEVFGSYQGLLEKPLKDGILNAWTNTSLYAFSQSINFLVNALVFWYGGQLIAYSNYELKQFFTVFVAIIFGSFGAGRLLAFGPDFSKAADSGNSVLKLIFRKPMIDSWSHQGKKVEQIQGDIQFVNVHFNYPTRPHIKVLQGLNVHVKPGQFAAFVGSSGCGKSTTIGLLERFYDATKGKILVDGESIRDYHLADYRYFIGLVSQEPNLFDLTIKENITIGCRELPTQEQIENACKDANIHEFIMSLPQQYETKLGGRGSQLSGGQRQRIAIARALIRNPKILLLDEATSALDAESEKIVQEALDKASKGRTTIAIAHRLSTIQHADVIYVFKDGVVHEQGNHQELLKLKGIYYELTVQQNLKTEGN